MNLSKFFIDRPIFAGVLSVLIFLAGLIALRGCPSLNTPRSCRRLWWCAPSTPAPTPR
jgi:hypothetical protein